MFKGLFVWPNDYQSINFNEMEEKGLNNIILSTSILDNYELCKQRINNYLNELKYTNIDLYLLIPPFKDVTNTIVDPANNDNKNLIISKVSQILTEIPELTGFSLDDFWYPSAYSSTLTLSERQQVLVNYLDDLKTAIHDIDTSKKLSANTWYEDYSSSKIDLLAPKLDFIQPELYRIYHQSHAWLKQKLGIFKKKVGNTPIVANLTTYYSSDPKITNRELMNDINSVLTSHVEGYALFNYYYSQSSFYGNGINLTFPSNFVRHTVNRRTVTRQIKN